MLRPFFEGYIITKIEDNRLEGCFIIEHLNRIIPFGAAKSSGRISSNNVATKSITRNLQTIFNQNGKLMSATFKTANGDYRELENILPEDSLRISTFDGAQAFLFTAKITDSIMNSFVHY